MTSKENSKQELFPNTRVLSISDGVFSIAMTLLVLNIAVPNLPAGSSNQQLLKALRELSPSFFNYILSFLVIAAFWTIHHSQYHVIKYVNSTMLWINNFILLFVALIPFSTSLQVEHDTLSAADLFFHINLLIPGLLYFLSWEYAVRRKKFTETELSHDIIVKGAKAALLLPVISSIAIIIAFIDPRYSSIPYIFIILLKGRIK